MTAAQTRPLGAQISHMLKDRGVEVIFGIPGVHNQELYRGIEEAGITHVLTRHEQGAGFMADGYARATGGFGVCYVITGPGLCNIMTPMGQAYSDSVSMLVLSSCLDETAARRGQLHQMKDQQGAAATVCDWSEEARTADAAYTLIDRALDEFQSQRGRPKHIQCPIALLEGEAPYAPAPRPNAVSEKATAPRSMAGHLVEHIENAKRPLFILGGGAVGAAQGHNVLAQVLERVQPATITSFAGRGCVATDYALNYGACLTRPTSADVIGQADLVIVLGTGLDEVDMWREEAGFDPDAFVIRVDIDPEVLATDKRANRCVHGDVEEFLLHLRDELGDTATSEWDTATVTQTRARWRAEVDAEFPAVLPVMDALKAAMPADVMIYSDMTQFAYAAKEVWEMGRPRHWHHPSGFGTLGYALPASIGGAVARPGLPTCCIHGDYGIQYTIAELATAVELGLPLPIIIWDNGKLGAIEDSMIAAQIAPNAVIQQNPDFLALAKAYGAEAVQPATLADIAPALDAAFAAKVPTIIRLTPDLVV